MTLDEWVETQGDLKEEMTDPMRLSSSVVISEEDIESIVRVQLTFIRQRYGEECRYPRRTSFCPVCKKRQFMARGVLTCMYGHGVN